MQHPRALFVLIPAFLISANFGLALGVHKDAPAPVGSSAPQSALACGPQWVPTFGGLPYATGTTIAALASYDSGSGPALYAATTTTGSAGGTVSRWDGWGWNSVGSANTGAVRAFAVYDAGGGPRLYAAGDFTTIGGVSANHIASFDGTNWAPLGSGTSGGANGSSIDALCVFDDGAGAQLYAGGNFSNAGGLASENLARWNGTAWSAFTTGMNGPVVSLAVFDDGSGPALYAGGVFTLAGGLTCNHIARWSGSAWHALGAGVSGGGGLGTTSVECLAVYDDGSGAALFAGGTFASASGTSASHVAKWDGTNWSALGSGVNSMVSALLVFDDGGGARLYAGGTFDTAGGSPASKIAAWNGASWSSPGTGMHILLGSGSPGVRALALFDGGSGTRLCAGGHFDDASGTAALNCATWSAAGWSVLGFGIDAPITSIASFDDGTGVALYGAGEFQHAGNSYTRGVARWAGDHWAPLPANPYSTLWDVTDIATFDDGSGSALYVADPSMPTELTKWDGTSWSPVVIATSSIQGMRVLDDGTGPALYFIAGGQGTSVVRWNGSSWSTLGSAGGVIRALEMYDDGSGPALYAGGVFTIFSGQTANRIAKWNGTNWSALGSGVNGEVAALRVYDGGSGSALYVGGRFDSAGGVTVNGIARWNGSSWSALGTGMGLTGHTPLVARMAVFDDGNGPQLFAGGNFDSANGVATHGLAKWNGSSWTDLALYAGSFPLYDTWIQSMAVADDGSPTGPALLVGGGFSGADGQDAYLAKWDLPLGCTPLGNSFCSPGSAGVTGCPCGNPPTGLRRGCDNSSATGGAQLLATGLASLSNDLVQAITLGEEPSAASIVLQGDAKNASGAIFGQGVRCVAGSLKRLYVQSAVGGSISVPAAGDAAVSARSAALGDTIIAGQHRYYGVYYRDPNVLGGCPASSTFNITQQVDLLWTP